MKTIYLPILFGLLVLNRAPALQAENIFAQSPEFCGSDVEDHVNSCRPRSFAIPVDPLSSNLPKSLASLTVTLSLVMKFNCQSNPESQTVNLRIGSTHYSYRVSKNTTAETLEYTTTADALPHLTYVITPLIGSESALYKTCRLEVSPPITRPSLTALSRLSDQLKEEFLTIDTLAAALEETAALTSRWNALNTAPETLDLMITKLDMHKQALEADALLLEHDPSPLSDKIQAAQDLISQTEAQILELFQLAEAIHGSLRSAANCASGSTEDFCLESIRKITLSVNAKSNEKRTEIEEFQAFLAAESERLSTTAIETSESLNGLLLN